MSLLRLLAKDIIRGIKRHKVRSLIIILIIAFGTGMSLVINNMDASFKATSQQIMERYNRADLVIWGNDTTLPENVTKLIKENIDGIKYIEPLLYDYGWTFIDNKTYQVLTYGVLPNANISKIEIVDGAERDFESNQSIFLERNALDKYHVNISINANLEIISGVGTRINVTVKGMVDALWAVPVGQIYPERIIGFMDFYRLQELLNMTSKIYGVQILVEDGADPDVVLKNIQSFLKEQDIAVHGYVYNSDWSLSSGIGTIVLGIISWPAFFIAMVLLAASIVQIIIQETRQIGMRKAIGYTTKQIMVYYILLGITLYGIGGLLGIGFGCIFTYLALKYVLSPIVKGLILAISYRGMVNNLTIGLIAAALFSFIAARHATKIDANYAIRYGIEKPSTVTKKIAKVSRMPFSVRFAWKNITRKRKRAIFLISALIISNIATFSMTYFAYSFTETYSLVGDMFLWDADVSVSYPVNNTVIRNLTKIDGVKQIEASYDLFLSYSSLKIYVNDELKLNDSYRGLSIMGLNESGWMIQIPIIEGQSVQENPDGITISTRFALMLGIKIGDTIRIEGDSWNHKNVSIMLPVTGIGQIIWNDGWLFTMSHKNMMKVLNYSEDVYNEIYFTADDPENVEALAKDFADRLSDYGISAIVLKEHVNEAISQISALIINFTLLIVGVVNIVAFVGAFALLYLVIFERKYDYMVLKSIGATKKDILKMAIIEILILSFIVTAIVIVPGYLISKMMMDVMTASNMGLIVNPVDQPLIYLLIPLHSVVLATLGYAYPTQKLLKEDPAVLLKSIL